tara:strand:+ start:114 stop:1346 length:1233 start_codon:yes stop_codon:yes gene_type:complete
MSEFILKGIIRVPTSVIRISIFALVTYFFYAQYSIEGTSANYSFVLIPIYYAVKKMRIFLPHKDLLLIMLCFCILFMLASLIQIEYWDIFYRKFVSFLLFFTAFLFAFIRVDNQMILAFKIGTLVFTLLLALNNLLEYRTFNVQDLGYAAKNQIGNQRYGFMYVFVFWMILFFKTEKTLIQLAKIPALILCFTGIFLTFSRSSIVAFAFSILILILYYIRSRNILTAKLFTQLLVYAALIISVIAYSGYYEYLLVPFEYFSEGFTELFSGQGINLSNADSSEGYRIYLIRKIIEFVSSNPIFGSGYLGIWILFEDKVGSAHGQLNDILFRTGIIGLLIYIYLLMKILKFLKENDLGMYIGFWGIIAFGMFHETFKLSHGAFLLAFIIGMWATYVRENYKLIKRRPNEDSN